MDALVMCGGRGSRLGGDEKPLRTVGGRPMVDRVIDALAGSAVETVYAATSSQAPATAAAVDRPTIETAGEGYVADLQTALADERVSQPILTVAADLPLLTADIVDDVLDAHESGATTVVVPVGRVRGLGFSVDTAVVRHRVAARPAGCNVVGQGEESALVSRRSGLAANVNRPRDLTTARWRAAGNSHSR